MPFATTVISRTREMLTAGFLKTPPAWWSTVNAYPPLTTQPITHVRRSAEDLPPSEVGQVVDGKQRTTVHAKIRPILYPEADKLRDRFLRDHPWEAARPATLVEGPRARDDYSSLRLSGKAWVELRQKSIKPSADDCIDFALNLHKAHELDLDTAYQQAVEQFRTLRARHEIETRFALLEARAYGAQFGPGIAGEGDRIEGEALAKWAKAVPTEVTNSSQSPVAETGSSEGPEDAPGIRSEFAGTQFTRPITDGTLNRVGHARREPDPTFTGGLSYLSREHKLDNGFAQPKSEERQQRGNFGRVSQIKEHSIEPRRQVFQDFRRTSLEQYGGRVKSNLPFSKQGWPMPRQGGRIKRRRRP